MTHTLIYGKHVIRYSLVRVDRKTLGITVQPDLHVVVRAPQEKAVKDILVILKKKAGWIYKQIQYYAALPPKPVARKYVAGETHKYLGRQYRLKIAEGKVPGAALKGAFILISVPDKSDAAAIRKQLEKWYLKHARERFDIYLNECKRKMRKYRIPEPSIAIAAMVNRWGSCGRAGRITLNPDLIKHSPLCIQYVIMHELCHLKHHNHDKNYYKLLSKVMPDWEKRKYKLDHSEI